jgi:hypothetical protein
MSAETMVNIEAVRVPDLRENYGDLTPLSGSIRFDGLRHPITLWTDGTLISGARRLRAHFLLSGRYRNIPAVFVDTIEDAAKRLLADNEPDELAVPMRPSEMARLWALLRQLDKPAALVRAEAARRRGVELRRQTQAGKRPPGRIKQHAEDYVMATIAPAFGMSEATASRLWTIHTTATGTDVAEDRRARAVQSLKDLDAGISSIWANYISLIHDRPTPSAGRIRVPEVRESAPAARQLAAWNKSLPQLEGLTAGLVELGPANKELTWKQVEPVYTRLMDVRRDLEKIIKQMRENKA